MATEVGECITLTSGRHLDVAHKDGGLTLDIECDDRWRRFVIPWSQYEQFVEAVGMAPLYGAPDAAVALGLDVLDKIGDTE